MTYSQEPGTTPLDKQLARVFNTAVISTLANSTSPDEIEKLMETEAFKSILVGTRDLANRTGLSERAAAEEIIKMFRKIEAVWNHYVFQEGIDKLKNPRPGSA